MGRRRGTWLAAARLAALEGGKGTAGNAVRYSVMVVDLAEGKERGLVADVMRMRPSSLTG